MIQSIPNPVPTSGEIRIARARLADALSAGLGPIRTPMLAGLGTADLVVDTLAGQLGQGLAAARELADRLVELARRAA